MKKANLTIDVLLSLCILLLTGFSSDTQKKENRNGKLSMWSLSAWTVGAATV